MTVMRRNYLFHCHKKTVQTWNQGKCWLISEWGKALEWRPSSLCKRLQKKRLQWNDATYILELLHIRSSHYHVIVFAWCVLINSEWLHGIAIVPYSSSISCRCSTTIFFFRPEDKNINHLITGQSGTGSPPFFRADHWRIIWSKLGRHVLLQSI